MTGHAADTAVARALLAIYAALQESALGGAERRLLTVGLLLARRLSGGSRADWLNIADAVDPADALIDTIHDLRPADPRLNTAWDAVEDALLRAQRTQPGRALAACVRQLAYLSHDGSVPPDDVGASVDLFLERLAEDDPRLAVVPPELAEVMARLAFVEPGHRVLDPCCGTGGLLIEAAREAARGAGAVSMPALYGQEAHADALSTAQLNLRLHGISDAELRHGDALQKPAFVDAGGGRVAAFDRVVTAPPLSARWKPAAGRDGRFEYGIPAPHTADYAYLQHAAASLAPEGRAVVLMPPGILYRGGRERTIRAGMVEAGLFEAIVALPRKLLFGTRTAAVLVVLCRREAGADRPVRFVDASSWLAEGRGRNRLRPEDVERVMALYADPASDPRSAALVEVARLRRAGYDLNLAQWVGAPDARAPVDLRAELEQVRALERERDLAAGALDDLVSRLLGTG